jgi:replicative DNA helicase
MIDRLPPQSLEAEQSVLGAILIDRDVVVEVAEFLRAEDFYRQANGTIYRAILDLFERREPVDIVTVAEALERMGELDAIGGRSYLSTLSNQTPTAVHAVPYARIVERKAVLRNLIGAAGKIAGIGYEDPAEIQEAIDRAEAELFAVGNRRITAGFSKLKDLLHEAYDRLDYLHAHRGEISGIRTGFTDLDALTTGLQKSDLIVIAARPSVGKTSFALNIAEYAAVRDRKSVGLFSLEMSKEQLVLRLLSSVANIDSQRLRTGFLEELDFARIAPAMNALSEAPIYIDDTPNISAMELRTKARRLQAEAGLDLVIVDYLQLMQATVTSRDSNRVQEVSEISRGLKALARELSVPVIALSQLSRQPEMRESKEPRLSDLRECVTGDSLVVLADGRRTPIRELVGTTPTVLAVSDRGRLIEAETDLVWKVGVRPIFDIRLATGRSFRATGPHRVMAGEGWQHVEDLRPGDRVALARHLPEPSNPEQWPDAHVILLGQLIGDGSYLKGRPLRYTTSSEANSATVTTAAREAFGCTVTRYAGRSSWHQLLISGNGDRWHPAGVNAWFRELGIHGQRSHEKRIPARAFRLSNAQVALLLRHLWATDGTIWTRPDTSRGGHAISYATNSPGLADDVAALLLRLGIVARIKSATKLGFRPGFLVCVSGGKDQRHFLETVGAFGPRVPQADKLQLALENRAQNTNVDTLPLSIWDRVRALMAAQGVSGRQMAAIRGTAYGGDAHFGFAPSREVLAEYADILGSPALHVETTNDLFWDRVMSIAPAGEEDVYDLTVPGPSNWLLDGIINHNSGAIEQDSDLVVFLWREKERGADDQ